jgi:hypothetical protein
MVDVAVCQAPNLRPVRLLQGGKAANVKRLQDMGGVWRHTESNNLAFLAEVLELKRLVALMAVNDQQLVTAYCTSLCMLDEVLQPGKTKLISGLAVLANANPPILWVVVILGLVMVLCFEDEEGWDRPPHGVDTSNQSDLLTIARLNTKWLETSLRRSNHLN